MTNSGKRDISFFFLNVTKSGLHRSHIVYLSVTRSGWKAFFFFPSNVIFKCDRFRVNLKRLDSWNVTISGKVPFIHIYSVMWQNPGDEIIFAISTVILNMTNSGSHFFIKNSAMYDKCWCEFFGLGSFLLEKKYDKNRVERMAILNLQVWQIPGEIWQPV